MKDTYNCNQLVQHDSGKSAEKQFVLDLDNGTNERDKRRVDNKPGNI